MRKRLNSCVCVAYSAEMQIITINSQKGGSGKTTLCANLAVAAAAAGESVAVVDTDPQGSLARWHELRPDDSVARVDVPLPRLPAALDVLRHRGVAWCLIDTAPSRATETIELCRLADLVVIPVIPSPVDLWAVAATVDQLDQQGKRFLFVLNQVKTQAAATAQTAAVLSERGRVARTFFAHRTGYAMAFLKGKSPLEITPNAPAAAEVRELWNDVRNAIMHKQENW